MTRKHYSHDGLPGLAFQRATEERQSFPTWVAFTLALIGGVGAGVICVLWWAS